MEDVEGLTQQGIELGDLKLLGSGWYPPHAVNERSFGGCKGLRWEVARTRI
jgi:hypothetical protein